MGRNRTRQADPNAPRIWCLFSVENNYDQPDHNLAAWWVTKPSLEKLAIHLGHPLDKASDEHIVRIVEIWKGAGAQINGPGSSHYSLEEVPEGKVE